MKKIKPFILPGLVLLAVSFIFQLQVSHLVLSVPMPAAVLLFGAALIGYVYMTIDFFGRRLLFKGKLILGLFSLVFVCLALLPEAVYFFYITPDEVDTFFDKRTIASFILHAYVAVVMIVFYPNAMYYVIKRIPLRFKTGIGRILD